MISTSTVGTSRFKAAGIILAAGASTRFGQTKQLVRWGRLPLVTHVADVSLAAGLDPVVVVLGHRAETVHAALGQRQVQTITNWQWKEGLSTSVKIGLAFLPPATDAVVVLQCDQPLVTPDLIRTLVARFEDSGAAIVHPACGGRRGTPTLFARRMFRELAAARGDIGGRAVIARHEDQVDAVEVSDPNLLADIDTPEDYRRLLAVAFPGSGSPAIRAEIGHIRHLIIDMDGVLWRGDQPAHGLREFFAFLSHREVDYVLATNNSSRLPEQYSAKLSRFGVEVPPRRVLTSAQATAAYLAEREPSGTPVFHIGGDGVGGALTRRGFVLTESDARYVVVGWDTDLTWRKLARAALLIQRGAGFIGTNPDLTFPNEEGLVPGNGAQLAALQVATGTTPLVIGKPEPWMYQEAMRRMNAGPKTTAVIGDRLDTDISGGVRAGLTTILVLSGITDQADLANSAVMPDLVYADIGELLQRWKTR